MHATRDKTNSMYMDYMYSTTDYWYDRSLRLNSKDVNNMLAVKTTNITYVDIVYHSITRK
jgi:hypothetical protein